MIENVEAINTGVRMYVKMKSKISSILDTVGFAEYIKVSNMFYLVLIYIFLFLAVCNVVLVILRPDIDDNFLHNLLSYFITKYQSLDDTQKNEIRTIFTEIFIDTNVSGLAK